MHATCLDTQHNTTNLSNVQQSQPADPLSQHANLINLQYVAEEKDLLLSAPKHAANCSISTATHQEGELQAGAHFASCNSKQQNDNTLPAESTQFLTELLTHKTKLIKFIPKAVRVDLANFYCNLLNGVMDNPRCLNAWRNLFLFSYFCLAQPPRGGKKTKCLENFIRNRINDFSKNNKALAVRPILRKAHKKVDSKNESDKILKIASQKIEEGDIKGGMRLLTSNNRLAAETEEVLNSLVEKHPQQSQPHNRIAESIVTHFHAGSSDTLQVLKTFPKGSSGGIDGLTPQHLLDMFVNVLECSQKSKNLETLTSFINFIFSTQLPSTVNSLFFSARLIALAKPDGGIRPIAVGHTLRRLCSKILNKWATVTLKNDFHQTQFGAGARCGTEVIIHKTRLHLANNPCDMLIKIDFKNAFNCLMRAKILDSVATTLPGAYQYILNAYEKPSILSYGSNVIKSAEGIQQGDAMGPLLFCMTTLPLVKQLSCSLNLWYMDDGVLAGSRESVLKNFDFLRTEAEKFGLQINVKKCEAFNAGDAQLPDEMTVIPAENLTLLGGALCKEAVTPCLRAKLEKLTQLTNKVPSLPAHHAYTLMKFCLGGPNLTSFVRSTPCCDDPVLSDIDNLLRHTISKVLNVNLTDDAWLQTSLPIKLGGFGIRDLTTLSIPAFLSSSIACKNIDPLSFDTNLFNQYLEKWMELSNTENNISSEYQKPWDDSICRTRMEQLKTGDLCTARIVSASYPASGDWLKAMPCKKLGLFLEDEEFRYAAALRLGLPVFQPHKCKCGAEMDAFAHHAFACSKNNGRFLRHSMVNEAISRSLNQAGCPTILEPPHMSEALRPDGITKIPFKSGLSLAWDVTHPHPLCNSHVILAKTQGAVANEAERKKKIKYAALFERFYFIPIAIDTIGAYGDEAAKLIQEIGQKLKSKTGEDRSTSYLKQKISILVQKGNSFTMNFSV